MSNVLRGRLVWSADKKRRLLIYPTKKGESQPSVFDLDQLAAALRGDPAETIAVDLEIVQGKPLRIRPVGKEWSAAPAPPPPPAPQRGQQGQQHGRQGGGPRQGGAPRHDRRDQPAPELKREFHNPYNFVPAPPRATTGPLADAAPAGHDHYHEDCYSGVIQVKMTTTTPLLILDAARARINGDDHKTFPIRVDAAGNPYLSPTSVKGMLRAAYEGVTNSRFGVFVGHEDRLGRRMVSNEGLGLVPCRVEGTHLRLLSGNSTITSARPSGPMYAAWLPSTLLVGPARSPFVPNHRDSVSCWIELWERTPWNNRQNKFEPHKAFQYWKILSVGPRGASLPRPSPSAVVAKRPGSNHHSPVGTPLRSVDGYACITEYNFDRKYNERVFFEDPAVAPAARTSQHDRLWRNLISNYRTNQDLQQGRPRPSALRSAGWSRHMTDDKEQELSDGTLAYALVEPYGSSWSVLELFPVCIARRLFPASPEELLDELLQPAYWIDRLSPADRVFGWVRKTEERRNQERPDVDSQTAAVNAYCGNLRVGPVVCTTEQTKAVKSFAAHPLPLAILGEPKAQQARFYVADSENGAAQASGLSKQDSGYGTGKGLRGRKVYPHHKRLPVGYWDDPLNAPTNQPVIPGGEHFIEYRRPRDANGAEQQDNQNRSIRGWVVPGTVFLFDIHVTNLSAVELGALLWLLTLEPKYHLRLGGGKPLGFGSVRLEIDPTGTDLRTGTAWTDWYSSLDEPTASDKFAEVREAAVAAFQTACGQSLAEVPFLQAFLKAAEGFDKPIHYPRSTVAPHPEGRAYEWFVANDREQQGHCLGLPLDDLATDQGLPYLLQ